MPSGPSTGSNASFQPFKAISGCFSIIVNETQLALETVVMTHVPGALTKVPSRGKEHAAHVAMTKVYGADTLVPALEIEPDTTVDDCPDVRAFNRLKIES